MRAVRSVVLAVAVALLLVAAVACEAKLEGARCPCLEPEYTCDVSDNVCRRAHDGGFDIDGSPDVADASLTPDAGFFTDASSFPDGGI